MAAVGWREREGGAVRWRGLRLTESCSSDRCLLPCVVSLKVEYDKLANEKTEMQRHYVMVRSRSRREQLWRQIAQLT